MYRLEMTLQVMHFLQVLMLLLPQDLNSKGKKVWYNILFFNHI